MHDAEQVDTPQNLDPTPDSDARPQAPDGDRPLASIRRLPAAHGNVSEPPAGQNSDAATNDLREVPGATAPPNDVHGAADHAHEFGHRSVGSRDTAAARRAMKRAQERLHSVAGTARDAGVLPREEVYALRQLYKDGRNAASRDELVRVAARYEREADRISGRLPLITAPSAGAVSVTDPDAAVNRPRRARRRGAPAAVEFVTATADERGGQGRRRGADELGSQQLEDLATRTLVVRAMDRGRSAREALTLAGIAFSDARKRWAQREFRKWRRTQRLGDLRLDRATAPTVLTKPMKELLFALWAKHPGATARGVRLLVKKHVELMQRRLADGLTLGDEAFLDAEVIRAGGPLPAVSTIRAFVRRLPRVAHTVREGGVAAYHRQERPVIAFDTASRPSEEWQADHTPLDVWVRVRVGGEWRRAQAYLTAAIDAYSRAIAGLVVSARVPDAWTTMHLLRSAILPSGDAALPVFGLPQRLVFDNGMDFKAGTIKHTLGTLGTHVHYCRPHNPDEKAEIERWFRTISDELLPILPGYKRGAERGGEWSASRVMGLATIDRLRREIVRWTGAEYHQREHTTTGHPPAEMWAATAGLIERVDVSQLDPLLLMADQTRVIHRGEVRFKGRTYFAPPLIALNGRTVQIRFNPDDRESILLYDAETERRLAEAWRVRTGGRYTDGDVLRVRQEFEADMRQRRRGLVERLPDYFAEAQEADRPPKQAPDEAEADGDLVREVRPAVVSAPEAVDDELAAMRQALGGGATDAPADAPDPADAEALLAGWRAAI